MVRNALHRYGFDLLQEVDVWLIGNPSALHRLPQVVRLGEPPGLLEIIPLEEDQGLIRIIDTSSPFVLPGPMQRSANRQPYAA
jgi:hypothetical protein